MQAFAEVLQVGGRSNSLGRTGEVVAAVLAEPARLHELLDCVHDDDAWVRMRAADAVEKVCRAGPPLLEPHVDELLATWTRSGQASVQWHLAQLLRQVTLSGDQRARAIDWLAARTATTEVDWIVAAESMRTLVDLAAAGHLPAGGRVVVKAAAVGVRACWMRRRRGSRTREFSSNPDPPVRTEGVGVTGPD